MARKRRQQPRKPVPRRDEMVVYAGAGESRDERRLRCNRSVFRLRTSLRRTEPETS